jgi:hypothetical protein
MNSCDSDYNTGTNLDYPIPNSHAVANKNLVLPPAHVLYEEVVYIRTLNLLFQWRPRQ